MPLADLLLDGPAVPTPGSEAGILGGEACDVVLIRLRDGGDLYPIGTDPERRRPPDALPSKDCSIHNKSGVSSCAQEGVWAFNSYLTISPYCVRYLYPRG